MEIIIKAERQGSDGRAFVTKHKLAHVPVPLTPGAAGWQGEGAGLSAADLSAIVALLDEYACNVHKLTIRLK